MTLADFIEKWRMRHGTDSLPQILQRAPCEAAIRSLSRIPQLRGVGTNVLDREWDVLVIFDACRYDMYRDVVNPHADWIWSVASHSQRWMERTFDQDVSDVAYVTGNVFSHTLDPGRFGLLDEVWREHWSDDHGTILPGPITDAAIAAHRSGHDRVIAHYMQPHYPFIPAGDTKNMLSIDGFYRDEGNNQDYVWKRIRNCERSIESVRPEYWNNLRLVAEELDILRQNVEGTVAVTADHGNSLGEFGIWGHRKDIVAPYMRIVPWDTFEARDEETVEPNHEPSRRDDEDVEDRLEALGYV